VRNKMDAQVTYGVGFGCSIYGRKKNFIEFQMAPVSCKNSRGVVRTQIWHKADQADATGQTGVPQRSDRWGVL
jgi:hypothetical protein